MVPGSKAAKGVEPERWAPPVISVAEMMAG